MGPPWISTNSRRFFASNFPGGYSSMPSTGVPSSEVQRNGLPLGRSRSVNSLLNDVIGRAAPSSSALSAM